MLTFEQIKKYYSAELLMRSPKAVLVEYLQYELLDSIFQQTGSEYLSFIGGTAIRIVYNSSRFSEDLDFDNFGLAFEDFEILLKRAVANMEDKGFDLEFRLVEKGAYHCFIKFPQILSENGLPQQPGEKILVRVDAVRKEKLFESKQHILDSFAVYRRILVNAPDIILSQKIIAILERKRAKGRDFYDVSFLLGLGDPNFEYIEKRKGIKRNDLLSALLKRIDELNMPLLVKDVLPFLQKPSDQERILSFREYVEQRLK